MKAIQFNPAIPRYILGRAAARVYPSILWSGLSCTQYVEAAEPALPGDDWAKIQTRYGGICGTDLSTLRLHTSLYLTPFCSFPSVYGHEGVGTIFEVGPGIRDFRSGDRVVLEPTLWCKPRGMESTCRYCQRGAINLCEHTSEGKLRAGLGIGGCRDTGGTWSPRFVAHASQLHRIPDRVSDKNALMVEPFATALHAVLRNFPADDETVIVLGAGTIGLCVVAALRALRSQARLVVLARHRFQADAAEKLGASSVITGGQSQSFQEVAKFVGARILHPMMGKPIMVGGVDRIFECVGSQSSIAEAVAMARAGGLLILVGVPSTVQLDWSPILFKQLTISASYSYDHAEEWDGKRQGTFEIALNLMNEGKVDLEWMITHVFRLEEYKAAFEMLTRRGQHETIKAIFAFE